MVKLQPKLKKRQLSSKQLLNRSILFGHQGESQAARFLVKLGYKILEQNIRVKNQEVDIIAFDPKFKEIVFVEVKSRGTEQFGNPSGAVNREKIRRMQRVAQIYLERTGRPEDYRFDILAVLPGTIHHYQNITWDL